MDRYMMENKKLGLMIQHSNKAWLVRFRSRSLLFRGCRIKSMLQLFPSSITEGVIYNSETGSWKKHSYQEGL